MQITLHRDGSTSRELRQVLDLIGVAADFSIEDTFALQVAVSEAVTNALVHGGDEEVEVAIDREGDVVDVTVWSRGLIELDRADPQRYPDSEAEGGRGIPLMYALVDEVRLDHSPDGTTVRLRKRLHAD
jgi:anti-sigma regulatory factor (Ser/Thr protein kinase)